MAITEYREVRFDSAALRDALQVWLTAMTSGKAETRWPAGTVVAATIARPDPVLLSIEIASPDSTECSSIKLEAVEVAAALVRACMQRGIRLPRQGAKSVRATQAGVALVVTIARAETAAARSRAA